MNLLPTVLKTVALPIELLATYDDVLPQLLTDFLSLSIQHTKYLSPAGYLIMICDPWDVKLNTLSG